MPDLKLEEAIQMSCTLEMASHDIQHFKGDDTDKDINKIDLKGKTNPKTQKNNECFRCGLRNHSPQICWSLKNKCKICGKQGHYARKCRSKKKNKIESVPKLKEILSERASLFDGSLGCLKDFTAKLYIKEETTPRFCKPGPVPFALKDKIEEQLNKMVEDNILIPVRNSEWATPIVPVLKPNGKVCICADYRNRKVNEQTARKGGEGGVKFSKLDFKKTFHQILMEDESQEMLTINIYSYQSHAQFCHVKSHVKLRWASQSRSIVVTYSTQAISRVTRLPFGIASTPAIFQSYEENFKRLNIVLKYTEDIGLKLSKEKCTFMSDTCDTVQYLSHVISVTANRPITSNTEAIVKVPRPRNAKQLRSFLGMVIYYSRFIPKLSSILQPLYSLLKKNLRWIWTEQCQNAFRQIKELLRKDLELARYDPEEALGIIFAIKKFNLYLRGRHFKIWTDHKSLASLFNPSKVIPCIIAARMLRWILFLTGYNYQISYLKSEENVLLTCYPDYQFKERKIMNKRMKRDPILSSVLELARYGWSNQHDEEELRPFTRRMEEITMDQECLLWGNRQDYISGPRIDEDIENLVRTCEPCQQNRDNPPTALQHPWECPHKPWKRIHIDFAGPFHEKTFLLVIDAYSK
ncbi:K02A2.6-like [Cordylochernes scorpioides]|uniref:K02A2.6-like n=1 Tax=Cordylochernes scorpioides TaxID=51811 RepID=A0ABY6LGY7_9ARAC|nr:K02A2.6-like [Cordylochernes scorpioides]